MDENKVKVILAAEDVSKKAFDQFSKRISGVASGVQVLKTAIAAMAGALAVGQLKDASVAMWDIGTATKAAENAYKAIAGSVSQSNEELKFLRETADDLGQNFYVLRDGYKGFFAATKNSNMALEESRKVFRSVTNAGSILGLSNDKMKMTFMALEQMISKGKVSMEELRRQLGDNLPGAFQIATKAMGVTTKQLDAMISSGQVMTEDFLPKFAAQLDKNFIGKIDPAIAAQNKFSEAWMDLWNKSIKPSFMNDASRALGNFTKLFKDPETIEAMKMFASSLGWVVEKTSELALATKGVVDYFIPDSAEKRLQNLLSKRSEIEGQIASLGDMGKALEGVNKKFSNMETLPGVNAPVVDGSSINRLKADLASINAAILGVTAVMNSESDWSLMAAMHESATVSERVKKTWLDIYAETEDANKEIKSVLSSFFKDLDAESSRYFGNQLDWNKQRIEGIKEQAREDADRWKTSIDAMNRAIAVEKSFYDDLDRATLTSTEYQLKQIGKKYEALKRTAISGVDIEKWKSEQIERINNKTWDNYVETISDQNQQIQKVLVNTFQSAEDTFVDFVKTGKLNFSDLIDSMISDLARLAFRSAITSSFSGITGWVKSILPSAHGNAFGPSGVMAFAHGGVVTSPTLFKFASGGSFGTGVMGEAGPEVVAPLFRGSSGDMGVKSLPSTINMSVNIDNRNNSQVTTSEPKWDGRQWVLGIVIEAVNQNTGGFKSQMAAALSGGR